MYQSNGFQTPRIIEPGRNKVLTLSLIAFPIDIFHFPFAETHATGRTNPIVQLFHARPVVMDVIIRAGDGDDNRDGGGTSAEDDGKEGDGGTHMRSGQTCNFFHRSRVGQRCTALAEIANIQPDIQ